MCISGKGFQPGSGLLPLVATTSDENALYYLGKYDVLLEKSRISEQPPPRAEFGRDRRTGRPIVSTAESVDRIMSCIPDGLIVTDDFRWRKPAYLDEATADLIVQLAEPIPLPAETRILAFHWANGDSLGSEACADLEQLIRPDRRG